MAALENAAPGCALAFSKTPVTRWVNRRRRDAALPHAVFLHSSREGDRDRRGRCRDNGRTKVARGRRQLRSHGMTRHAAVFVNRDLAFDGG